MIFAKRAQNVDYDYVRLKGGLDELTPTIAAPPGIARSCQNFECSMSEEGGYTRIAGYERFDGHESPSGATYIIIQCVAGTNLNVLGSGTSIKGLTSLATGVVCFAVANANTPYIVVTGVQGTFTTSEMIYNVALAANIGNATPQTVTITALQNAQYLSKAAVQTAFYVTQIQPLPGVGATLGVVAAQLNGIDQVFGFRQNASGFVYIYKASPSGWQLIPYYNYWEVGFSNGGSATRTPPTDGASYLSQSIGTNKVVAKIRRVLLESGSWSGGTAAGRFIIETWSGGGNFVLTNTAQAADSTVTLTTLPSAVRLLPGGLFEFAVGNCAGQQNSLRIYGCDGANHAFEFDGETLCPIHTGTTPDNPKHIVIHKNQLLLSILSSIVHSAPGNPFDFAAVDGASEIPVGNIITNFIEEPGSTSGGTLTVTTIAETFTLYGSGASTWNLVSYNAGVGAAHYTGRTMGQSFWWDVQGIMSLRTTLNYGNFVQSGLTNHIPTTLSNLRGKKGFAVLNRMKNQYRLLFEDGSGLYMTMVNGKFYGIGPVQFPVNVNCAWNSTWGDLSERMFFGDTNGYVYELDKGSSFDGTPINAFLTLNWNASRSPRVIKRYRNASVEVVSNSYVGFSVGYALGYNTSGLIAEPSVAAEGNAVPMPNWDSFTWDSFTWDGSANSPVGVKLYGSGVNIQLTITSNVDYLLPFTIPSVTFHYTPRRGVRE